MTNRRKPWLPAARARLNFVLSFTDQVGLLDVVSAAWSLATAGTLALAWRAS